MVVLLRFAVRPALPHLHREVVAVGGDHAAIAHAAEVLAGVEAERAEVADRPAAAALVPRAVRLAVVFDHLQAVLRRDGHDGIHVGRLAVEMHRDNGLGLLRDDRGNERRVDVVGDRVAIDQHRHRAKRGHRERRGDEGVAGHDHFVARADAHRLEGQAQGVEARAHADGVLRPHHPGELALEGVDLRAEDVLAVHDDVADGGLDLIADRRMMGIEINKRYDVHASPLQSKAQ
jgi:hypothetical protein